MPVSINAFQCLQAMQLQDPLAQQTALCFRN